MVSTALNFKIPTRVFYFYRHSNLVAGIGKAASILLFNIPIGYILISQFSPKLRFFEPKHLTFEFVINSKILPNLYKGNVFA